MALINQNSVIGVTSITSPGASNVLTVHTSDTTERLRVSTSGLSFSGTNASLDTSGNLTVGGNVSIGGTLTYEDVTNIDSVGIITAQAGINVTGGSVGIGTDNPGSHKLQLYGASNVDQRITCTGNDIINLFVNSNRSSANDTLFAIKGEWNGTQVANIKFNVGDDTTNKDDGYITFNTRESGTGSSSERLRITSAGLIGIGTVSPSGPIHAHIASGTQRSYFEASASHSLLRLKSASTSYNTGVEFFSGASNIANINGLGAGDLQFEVGGAERLRITSAGQLNLAGNMQFTAATPELELNNGGPRFRVPAANTLTIHTGGGLGATSNERLRIQSGGGISFNGDTAAANALDDYEEGTFLPTMFGSTVAGSTTYSLQYGYYVKVGKLVHFQIRMTVASSTATGHMRVGGLPFVALNDTNRGYASINVSYANNITLPSGSTWLGAYTAAGGSHLVLIGNTPGNVIQTVSVDTSWVALIGGTYIANV